MSTATTAQPKLWNGGKSPFNVEYGKLMMWYFLMSDAFTFGAFLISYGTIRFSSNGWLILTKFSIFPWLRKWIAIDVCKFNDFHFNH
jgi:heme/copper-type cytochrome/quinol oxidase subunit 3